MYENDGDQIFQALDPDFGLLLAQELILRLPNTQCYPELSDFHKCSVVSWAWVLDDAELISNNSLQITKPQTSIFGLPF